MNIPINEWTHLVITYDADSTSNAPICYINGVAVGTEQSLVNNATYNTFTEVSRVTLQSGVSKINEIIDEYRLVDKIRPHISDQIRWNVFDIDAAASNISIDTGVNEKDVKLLLLKYKISKLFTLDTDISQITAKSTELQTNLANIQDFVLEQYERIR